jgi:hypothetical protein
MVKIIFISLLFISGMFSGSSHGQEAKKEEISKEAEKALNEYRKNIHEIRKSEYIKAKMERKRLLEKLEKIMVVETKKGDLESAWALKNKIAAIRKRPFVLEEILIDPAAAEVPQEISGLGKTFLLQTPSPLVQQITKGRISSKRWDDLEGTIVEVSAAKETKTNFRITKKLGILVVPHPGDTWHGKEGLQREYPWVGYAGQNNRTYRNLPLMSLCYRLDTSSSEGPYASVLKTPAVFGNGELVLQPNDGNLSDNLGKIRVKLLPVMRK